MDKGVIMENPLTKIFIIIILFSIVGFISLNYVNKNNEDSYNFGELKITKCPNESYILNVTSEVKILTINQNSEWVGTIDFEKLWDIQNP
jgi:hypothetical protein